MDCAASSAVGRGPERAAIAAVVEEACDELVMSLVKGSHGAAHEFIQNIFLRRWLNGRRV